MTPYVIYIENCSFIDNYSSPGSAIAIHQAQVIDFLLVLQIIIKNCTFMGNSYPATFLPSSIQKFEHDLINTVTLFIDCRFEANSATPMYAYDS